MARIHLKHLFVQSSMQISDFNTADTLIASAVSVLSATDLPHRSHVRAALLLGSATTGEMCRKPKTSDLDLLLVMNDEADERGCSALKDYLRLSFATTQPGVPLGLRCRYPGEMVDFSRYLALQGYHLPGARVLYVRDPEADVSGTVYLNEFPRHPATEAEFLCVFGECLWGEIRSKAKQGNSLEVDCYLEAKVLLSYLNLLLVADGVFLPTHRERAAYWKNVHSDKSNEIIDAAVAIKAGDFTSPMYEAMPLETKRLRDMCLKMCRISEKLNTDGMDPAAFWLPRDHPYCWSERARMTREICMSMAAKLSHADAIEPNDPAIRIDGNYIFRMATDFIRTLSVTSFITALHKVHAYRIKNAEPARRDWGHIETPVDKKGDKYHALPRLPTNSCCE